MFSFKQNSSPLFFISCSRQYRHWNLVEKKPDSALFNLLFFFLKVRVAMRFTAKKQVASSEKFHSGLHIGWTYVRTYVRTLLSEPKFLGCIDNPIFLPIGSAISIYLNFLYYLIFFISLVVSKFYVYLAAQSTCYKRAEKLTSGFSP